MVSGSIYIVCFSVAILVYFWRRLYDFAQYRLKLIKYVDKLPGPTAIPILGTTWQFKWNAQELAHQMRDWGLEYSAQGHGLIKIWLSFRPLILCIRPESAKAILESNTIITKGPEYNILEEWLGNGLLISTGSKWHSRRKMLTPSFHFQVLNDFLEIHDAQSQIFVEQISKYADKDGMFDIFPYIKRCALDIICETAMGTSVSAQTQHNHPYVLAVKRLNELAFLHERMPWMWLKIVWYLSGYGPEYNKTIKTVTDFTRKVINDKLSEVELSSNDGKKKAFLDLLVDLLAKGEVTYEDVRAEVDTFMFEGHDTTAASMGWTLWSLAHHPDCQEKIFQELYDIFGESDRECTSEDLKRMKYLEWCIKESLRLRPSVPMFSRIAEKDIEIDGFLVPEGSTVIITPFLIHTNQEVYENPESYNPERFADDNLLKRQPYAYIPFSAGPRNCIGQKFALMEEKTVLSWFFRRYKLSTSIPYEENVPLPEIIIRPSLGIPVKIEHHTLSSYE
ncbi:unnamed protein product [Auanema sp. JU1783]|nr:unnamed protein product [Auanema sp. JU1783]